MARDVLDELPADLLWATSVLVWRDGHLPPLEPLYNSPYRMPQPRLVPHASRQQDGHHLHQPPQALSGPCSAASGPPMPWLTPWAAQSDQIPLAACGATPPGPPTCAGDVAITLRALACFGCCEDVITAWVGARNHCFSPTAGVFCTLRPLLGTAALHTDQAAAMTAQAAGPLKPVTSSGGAMWRVAWAPVASPASARSAGFSPSHRRGGGGRGGSSSAPAATSTGQGASQPIGAQPLFPA
jgi:hypothetical protein